MLFSIQLGCGMSKLNGQAKAVLDACLSAESPEVRAKVYQIIDVSGLEPSDPMFLILALTGQMRVLLEAAPADLSKLLTDWKEQSSQSLQQIQQVITQVRETQQQQANTIRQTLETVTTNCVEDIKQAGMAATSAIAQANESVLNQSRETLIEAQQLKNEIIALRASVEQDRQTNIEVSNAVLGQIGQSSGSLDTAVTKINQTHTDLTRLQRNTTWIKFTEWFSPLAALVIVLLVGIGSGGWVMWAKDNDSIKAMSAKDNDSLSVLGRNLVHWNADRILKCKNDNNSKCTLWLKNPR